MKRKQQIKEFQMLQQLHIGKFAKRIINNRLNGLVQSTIKVVELVDGEKQDTGFSFVHNPYEMAVSYYEQAGYVYKNYLTTVDPNTVSVSLLESLQQEEALIWENERCTVILAWDEFGIDLELDVTIRGVKKEVFDI